MEPPIQAAADLFSKANAAFVNEEYNEAVELYGKAIKLDGYRPEYYTSRSHALQKLDRFAESKIDALKALDFNPTDPKAFLRKGIACFHLEQFEEAQEAFQKGAELGGSDTNLSQWLKKTGDKIASKPQTVAPPNAPSEIQPKLVIKHDWYQTESHVCVTVLAKNLDPASVNIQFSPTTLSMKARLPDETDYNLDLNLTHAIVPEFSSYQVMKSKVEVKMKKSEGLRWNSLEGQLEPSLKQIPVTVKASTEAQPPVYPSSAPKKKDWDKIESQIKKEEAEEKPEGEAALNQLFQKIYIDGSDEIRRAMNKSFQESGGTVLSTNWNEVAKEKVTVKPPDGMEYKKWD